MKKQFSHRRNTGRGGAGTLVWSVGGILFVLVILFSLRVLLPSVFIALATPLWKEGTSLDAGVGNAFSGFTDGAKIAGQNTNLAQQVAALQDENAVLTARAQDLARLLGGQMQTNSSSGNVLAGVLARPPESPYDTILVASGSKEGVVVGAQVFATGGIPIGTVRGVTAHTATVQLLSAPGVATNGWIGSNRIPFTLTGTGAGTFTATLPKAATVSVGDSAYVPGPGAVPLGTITRIDSDPSSPTVVLYIQPFVNIFSITWVEIAGGTQ